MKLLTKESTALITDYVDSFFKDYLAEEDDWALGKAWMESQTVFDKTHIAAAIIYQGDSLSDPPYRVLGERGSQADKRLCAVADQLELA